MSDKKLTLNLITPEKQLIKDKPVDMVILPALLGEMGILPGHVKTVVSVTAMAVPSNPNSGARTASIRSNPRSTPFSGS